MSRRISFQKKLRRGLKRFRPTPYGELPPHLQVLLRVLHDANGPIVSTDLCEPYGRYLRKNRVPVCFSSYSSHISALRLEHGCNIKRGRQGRYATHELRTNISLDLL